jgi:hypothetical protein
VFDDCSAGISVEETASGPATSTSTPFSGRKSSELGSVELARREALTGRAATFAGNVEGKDRVNAVADVVVTDAVAGNIVIKFFEGLSTFIFDLFRAEFRGSLRGRLAYLLLRPGIGRIRRVFDYERAGGSPLLGVKGSVIITHGRAKRRMVGFACAVAAETARTGVPALIAEALREDSQRVAAVAARNSVAVDPPNGEVTAEDEGANAMISEGAPGTKGPAEPEGAPVEATATDPRARP